MNGEIIIFGLIWAASLATVVYLEVRAHERKK